MRPIRKQIVMDKATGIEFEIREFKALVWPDEWSSSCRELRRRLKRAWGK